MRTIIVEPQKQGDGWTVETVEFGEVDRIVCTGPHAREYAQLFADVLRLFRDAGLAGAEGGR